jgi:hypothetical protein
MARKGSKPRREAGVPQPADAGADDLEILHPEREATIAGRRLVVREYGFIEGLRLRPLMQSLLDDLHQLLEQGGDAFTLEAIESVLGTHTDEVIELMAIAADVEPNWVATLNDQDGMHLLHLWWTVNGPFFVRRSIARLQAERVAAASRTAGATSTPPSSPADTEPQPPSVE